MPLETNTSNHSSGDGNKHTRVLDKEIKDMVSAITSRISGIHKPGSSHDDGDDDKHGASIITLAGSNEGATMRCELDEKSSSSPHEISLGDPDVLSTYVNSNFQAVNNSIMFGSSYNANDPGVHLDISDVSEHEGKKSADKQRRGKKIQKDSIKTEHSN